MKQNQKEEQEQEETHRDRQGVQCRDLRDRAMKVSQLKCWVRVCGRAVIETAITTGPRIDTRERERAEGGRERACVERRGVISLVV